MPLLDHTRLDSLREWQRAHMVLSAIGSGYVWQSGEDEALNVSENRHGLVALWLQFFSN